MSTTEKPTQPLPEKFTALGFHHELVTACGPWRIYKRWKDGQTNAHFEVIRVQIRTKTFADGAWVDCAPREGYPSAEQWGTHGFTCQDEARARARLVECTTG